MENKEQFILLDTSYLPQMAELFRASFGREPWNDDWSDSSRLTEYIRDIFGAFNSLNYGLMSEGRLMALSIGTVRHWWEGTNYNIEEFCVLPEIQGKGVGTRFMKLIEEDIRSRGIAGIFLQTDIDKPSFAFYSKNGFSRLDAHISLYKRVDK